MREIEPLGETAWLAQFNSEEQAQAWARIAWRTLKTHPGVYDVVLAYRSVAVYADDPTTDLKDTERLLRQCVPLDFSFQSESVIEIPVLYEGEDLPEIAAYLRCSVSDVIMQHSAQTYTVYALGFLPGFPYCGYLPDALAGLPRRTQPRTRVPAGTVAIAGRHLLAPAGVPRRLMPNGGCRHRPAVLVVLWLLPLDNAGCHVLVAANCCGLLAPAGVLRRLMRNCGCRYRLRMAGILWRPPCGRVCGQLLVAMADRPVAPAGVLRRLMLIGGCRHRLAALVVLLEWPPKTASSVATSWLLSPADSC